MNRSFSWTTSLLSPFRFVFNALLAASAHLAAGDQQWAGAAMALVFGLISYFTGKKVGG